MAAVLAKVVVSPLLEVLTHGSHLFATLYATHRWKDAAAARSERQVEAYTLQHESQVELPVVFAVLCAHQVLPEVVADGA